MDNQYVTHGCETECRCMWTMPPIDVAFKFCLMSIGKMGKKYNNLGNSYIYKMCLINNGTGGISADTNALISRDTKPFFFQEDHAQLQLCKDEP